MTTRKFYIITEKVITQILNRDALLISIRSSKDILKSTAHKNMYFIKEISKAQYKNYMEIGHKFATGQLVIV